MTQHTWWVLEGKSKTVSEKKIKITTIHHLRIKKKTDQVNFHKDFWDCYKEKEQKIGQWLTSTSPATIEQTIMGQITAPVPFLLLKWQINMKQLVPNKYSWSLNERSLKGHTFIFESVIES